MKRHIVYFLLAFMIINNANAQSTVGTKYRALYMFDQDVNKFANGYLAPIFKGIGYGFHSGWYSTAKPHQPLGIDLSFGINLAFVPKSDYLFTIRNSDYNHMRLASGTEAESPTFFGSNKKEDAPDIEIFDDVPGTGEVLLATIGAPEGIGLKDEIGFSAVPIPILQLGIGLIKNTDLKIRYAPDVSKDLDYSFWGLGLMHDITQWIPVVDKLPIDISVFGSYSHLTFDAPLSGTGFTGAGQAVKAKVSGFTVEALVSKKIAVLTLLGGIGFVSGKTDFDLLGTYNITYPDAPTIPGYDPSVTLQDPIGIATKQNGMKLTGGIQLQFAVFKLFANYSFMHYNVLNAGLGLTFR